MAGFLDRGGFENEAEAGVVASVIVFAAAGEAGFATAEGAHAGDFGAAGGADVEQFTGDSFAAEGELVAAGFVDQAQVGAGLFPFRTVGGDALEWKAGLGDEVGQLVPEGAINFSFANEGKRGVENDAMLGMGSEASGGPQSGRPPDSDPSTQLRAGRRLEEGIDAEFKEMVATKASGRAGSGWFGGGEGEETHPLARSFFGTIWTWRSSRKTRDFAGMLCMR
jgi:hypothetical protein